jgi:mannose-6-phosphate isomerase-like protein (cupin superfamily)
MVFFEVSVEKINLLEKFALFDDHFSPKLVGQINDTAVKLVKFDSEFVWHHHEFEDEMFFVVRGSFEMQFRDRTVKLGPGEFLIVPRRVEHCPKATEEVWVMLIEPASVLNTGNVVNERTVANLERI